MAQTTYEGIPLFQNQDADAHTTNAAAWGMADLRFKRLRGFRNVNDSGDALDETDRVVFGNATGGAFTTTLPDAADWPGRTFIFRKMDATANDWTLDSDGGNFDGSSTYVLDTQDMVVHFISDGANWRGIGLGTAS